MRPATIWFRGGPRDGQVQPWAAPLPPVLFVQVLTETWRDWLVNGVDDDTHPPWMVGRYRRSSQSCDNLVLYVWESPYDAPLG